MNQLIALLQPRWKAVVAFVVVIIGGGLAQGLIVGAPAAWATIVIGALATIGVHAVPNKP